MHSEGLRLLRLVQNHRVFVHYDGSFFVIHLL